MATKIINCVISQNKSYYKAFIEYSYTQSKTDNTTKVTAALKLQQLTDSFDFDTGESSTNLLKVSFVMNGETYTHTGRINMNDVGNAGYTITLVSTTQTITHDNDGTKQIDFSCNNTSYMLASAGYGPGNITLNRTVVTLPTIPRAATLDKITNAAGKEITEIDAGQNITVYYTAKSSEYYHRAYYYVGSEQKARTNISATTNSTSVTVDPGWFPSSESGTLTCKIYTYSDAAYTKKIGNQNKNITVNIPTTLTPTTSLTINATDYGHELGEFYLQGLSPLELTAEATAGQGSNSVTLTLSGDGFSESKTATDTETEPAASIIKSAVATSSGELTYTATATDSRLRSKSASKTISVLPYQKPSYAKASVIRCRQDGTPIADGEYALVQIQCNVQSIMADTEKNTQQIKVQYRLSGSSTWNDFATTKVTPRTNEIITITNTAEAYRIDPNKTYKFKATVTDALGNSVTTSELSLRGNQRPINVSRNNTGVAIGGLSTSDDRSPAVNGLFEVMWPSEIFDSVSLLGTDKTCTINSAVVTNGDVTMQGDKCTVQSPIRARSARDGDPGYAIVTRSEKIAVGSDYEDVVYYLSAVTTSSGGYKLGMLGRFADNDMGFAIDSSVSDIRLKENVEDCTINALNIVEKMDVRQFDWKNGEHQNIGFIADELENVDPRLTIGGGYLDDGSMNIKSIDTLYLLGYVTKAVQELATQVQLLSEQNEKLRRKVQEFELKIN